MTGERFDILVAGGGVAGLTATAVLAQAGFRTLCVDPQPPVTTGDADGSDLRSTAFLNPSVDLLMEAGIWPELAPHAAPLRIMRILDAGGSHEDIRERADFVASEQGHDVFGYNLPNWLIRRELQARLAGRENAELRTGVSAAHVTPRAREAIVRLSDGTQVRAALVIAADGRDSGLRTGAGIAARRWSYGQKALVFVVRHSLPHEDVSTEIHRHGGPLTFVPLPDQNGAHHSAVVWMMPGPEAAAHFEMNDTTFFQRLARRSCGILGDLYPASPRRIWPIISQIAGQLYAPRLALIAEAAHVVPPIGAQGLNMSLRDVAALRDLVGTARAGGQDIGARDLLARYEKQRHGDVTRRVLGIDALNRAAMERNPLLRDARRQGLQAIAKLAPLRRGAMRLGLGME